MKNIIIGILVILAQGIFAQTKKSPPAPIYAKVIDFEKRDRANAVFENTEVHSIAHYPKGLNNLETEIREKINHSKWTDLGRVDFALKLFVERDGSVSTSEVSNNKSTALNEEIKEIIKKINPEFTPAEIEGRKVRSYSVFEMRVYFYED